MLEYQLRFVMVTLEIKDSVIWSVYSGYEGKAAYECFRTILFK